jgi:tRNA modification GTPase
LGPPNAGKSSLLNALARRDIAIVSDIPGTTRDVLETRLNISGYAVSLADTAGLRATSEAIEAEGIRRALRRAEAAQVRLIVIDPDSVSALPDMLSSYRPGDIVVFSKADLGWAPPKLDVESLTVSTLSGAGLDALIVGLGQRAKDLCGVSGAALITRSRHREALRDAVAALNDGLAGADRGLDLVAENLRIAARAIGRITGRVDVEDVLDVVFRDFCIGK